MGFMRVCRDGGISCMILAPDPQRFQAVQTSLQHTLWNRYLVTGTGAGEGITQNLTAVNHGLHNGQNGAICQLELNIFSVPVYSMINITHSGCVTSGNEKATAAPVSLEH